MLSMLFFNILFTGIGEWALLGQKEAKRQKPTQMWIIFGLSLVFFISSCLIITIIHIIIAWYAVRKRKGLRPFCKRTWYGVLRNTVITIMGTLYLIGDNMRWVTEDELARDIGRFLLSASLLINILQTIWGTLLLRFNPNIAQDIILPPTSGPTQAMWHILLSIIAQTTTADQLYTSVVNELINKSQSAMRNNSCPNIGTKLTYSFFVTLCVGWMVFVLMVPLVQWLKYRTNRKPSSAFTKLFSIFLVLTTLLYLPLYLVADNMFPWQCLATESTRKIWKNIKSVLIIVTMLTTLVLCIIHIVFIFAPGVCLLVYDKTALDKLPTFDFTFVTTKNDSGWETSKSVVTGSQMKIPDVTVTSDNYALKITVPFFNREDMEWNRGYKLYSHYNRDKQVDRYEELTELLTVHSNSGSLPSKSKIALSIASNNDRPSRY